MQRLWPGGFLQCSAIYGQTCSSKPIASYTWEDQVNTHHYIPEDRPLSIAMNVAFLKYGATEKFWQKCLDHLENIQRG